MYISVGTVITAASLLTAIGVIVGVLFKAHRWYLKQEHQDVEIKELEVHHNEDVSRLKEENTLICYALSACLDGLQQLGANHTVPDAKNKLDKYLNQQAHK